MTGALQTSSPPPISFTSKMEAPIIRFIATLFRIHGRYLPSEAACTLNINVTARHQVVEHACSQAWEWRVQPSPPDRPHRIGRGDWSVSRVSAHISLRDRAMRCVFGSDVRRLLRYGHSDFKWKNTSSIEPRPIRARVWVRLNSSRRDCRCRALRFRVRRTVLAGGAEFPRDLPAAGRSGRHSFRDDFLPQHNHVVAGYSVPQQLVATDKHVIVRVGVIPARLCARQWRCEIGHQLSFCHSARS